MSNQQFGEWTVESTIDNNHVLVVSHPDKEGKFILKKARSDREKLRMKNEIKVLERVSDHPHILTLVDSNIDAELPWHITEKIEGERLGSVDFTKYPLEKLQGGYFEQQLNKLVKAFGYFHSKGVTLNDDIEIMVSDEGRFIILDVEHCSICDTHHLDTARDILTVAELFHGIHRSLDRARKKKAEEAYRKTEERRCHEQAQPSAPRRLAKQG